jgi:hypothetical protein
MRFFDPIFIQYIIIVIRLIRHNDGEGSISKVVGASIVFMEFVVPVLPNNDGVKRCGSARWLCYCLVLEPGSHPPECIHTYVHLCYC